MIFFKYKTCCQPDHLRQVANDDDDDDDGDGDGDDDNYDDVLAWHSLRRRREGTSGLTDRTHSRTGP